MWLKHVKLLQPILCITMETFRYLSKFQPIPDNIQKVLSGEMISESMILWAENQLRCCGVINWINHYHPSFFLNFSVSLSLSLRLIDSAVYNLLHAYLVLTYNSLWIFYVWYYYIFFNFLWQITCFVHFIQIGHAKIKKHAVLIPNSD